MTAQHPYPAGFDSRYPIVPPVPTPEYSRRFVLNLAGSASGLVVSTVVHSVVPDHHAPAGESVAPSVMFIGASAGWLLFTLSWIALRELRYGFNRMFPRVQMIVHVHLPQADGKRQRPKRRDG